MRVPACLVATLLALVGVLVRPPTASETTGNAPVTAVGGPLEHPYGLAVAAGNDLYIADVGRDQVLRRLPSGRYQVVAGDGRRGFSGDGGPAAKAELRLNHCSALAVAANGTLYIADTGNDRVRAVTPAGTITTAVGNGRSGQVLRPTPASVAPLGPPCGLTIGPTGELYVAADNLVRLGPAGVLQWVAGKADDLPCGSVFCNPAGESAFLGAGQLAFDRAGDLYVSGSSYGLFEIEADGHLRYLGQQRGDAGSPEALAEAPGGSVIEANIGGLFRLTAHGGRQRLPGNLDESLAPPPPAKANKNYFSGGDGLAIGPDSTVYADTNAGNAWTSVSALLAVSPGGKVTALWRS